MDTNSRVSNVSTWTERCIHGRTAFVVSVITCLRKASLCKQRFFIYSFIFKGRILKIASQLKFWIVFIRVFSERLRNKRASYGRKSQLHLWVNKSRNKGSKYNRRPTPSIGIQAYKFSLFKLLELSLERNRGFEILHQERLLRYLDKRVAQRNLFT